MPHEEVKARKELSGHLVLDRLVGWNLLPARRLSAHSFGGIGVEQPIPAYKEHTPKVLAYSPQVFQGGLRQCIALSDDRRTTPIQDVHVWITKNPAWSGGVLLS